MTVSYVDITLSVAVSETGEVKCCPVNGSNTLPHRRIYEQFLESIREDKKLWAVKTVRVKVPAPASYEDLIDDQKQEGKSG